MPSKEAKGVASRLLNLFLMYGTPIALRSEAGKEITASVVRHLCQSMKVTLTYGPANHPRDIEE